MPDLVLILNTDQQIPALRRVRSLTELQLLDLPPMAAGTTLSGQFKLCDGNGELTALSGSASATPLLVISRYGDDGLETLAIVTTFTREAGVGWTFNLPLTSQELADYLGTTGVAKEAVFDLSVSVAGALTLLYRRAVTLLPGAFDPASGLPTLANSLQIRPDLTTAALLRAVVTDNRTLPVVVLVLFGGAWNCYTLRAQAESGETDDGVNYIVPTDWHATTNKVVWVKTAIS